MACVWAVRCFSEHRQRAFREILFRELGRPRNEIAAQIDYKTAERQDGKRGYPTGENRDADTRQADGDEVDRRTRETSIFTGVSGLAYRVED
jgi:hypothetical protein